MAIVTDIHENRHLVHIRLDNRPLAAIRKVHFMKHPLSVGDEVDGAAYLARMAATQFADAYEAALTSLDVCARSAKELTAALRRKGYVEPAVQAVLARLTENGLVDDARYAGRMAEMQSRKPVGLYAFKRKLRAKGISEEDAEDALSIFDNAQQQSAALEAAQGLWHRYAELPEREARAKLSQALARRGFSWDAISNVMDQLFD